MMNHRKAIPVNGTKFSAMATAALRPESVSHAPAAAGLAGAETLNSIKAVIRSTEKTIPATAAARGFSAGSRPAADSGPSPDQSSGFDYLMLAADRVRLIARGAPDQLQCAVSGEGDRRHSIAASAPRAAGPSR